jgi:hypothetical protein
MKSMRKRTAVLWQGSPAQTDAGRISTRAQTPTRPATARHVVTQPTTSTINIPMPRPCTAHLVSPSAAARSGNSALRMVAVPAPVMLHLNDSAVNVMPELVGRLGVEVETRVWGDRRRGQAEAAAQQRGRRGISVRPDGQGTRQSKTRKRLGVPYCGFLFYHSVRCT